MLLRYLFGRQLLCHQCLSFIKPLTRQQRFQFLLSRKKFSTAPARARFFIPPENEDPPRVPQELQDRQKIPPLLENGENQTATTITDPTTTTESASPDTALDGSSEPPPDLSHIPKNAKLRNDDIIPLNGEIRYVDANLVHQGIVKFDDVINSFDRSKYILLCVNPSVVSQNEPPTCLLTSVADFLERERREAEAAALALLKKQKPAITTRVLEFTWAISEHDLAHKMKKMGEFMQKGYRVEVFVGTRKGMAKVKAEQAKELVAKVKEAGAMFGKEWKKEDGALGAQFTLFFEGKTPVKSGGEEEKAKEGKKKKKKRKFMTPEELEAERENKQGEDSGIVEHVRAN